MPWWIEFSRTARPWPKGDGLCPRCGRGLETTRSTENEAGPLPEGLEDMFLPCVWCIGYPHYEVAILEPITWPRVFETDPLPITSPLRTALYRSQAVYAIGPIDEWKAKPPFDLIWVLERFR